MSDATKRKSAYPPVPERAAAPIIDNHTHLEHAFGDEHLDPIRALDLAEAAGVVGVVQVGDDVPTSRFSVELARQDPRVLAAVALHPNEAARLVTEQGEDALALALDEIERLVAHPRVRAVGETGLDYFRTAPGEGRDAQLRSFERHIEWAKTHGRALQIHDRDAHDDVVATLLRVGAPEKTVMHCFSGDAELARLCAEHGWLLSFAGNVTFKANEHLREAARAVPVELLLVETDAPFLTPVPGRGRPNSPYMVVHTMRALAELRGMSEVDFANRVRQTTIETYGEWA